MFVLVAFKNEQIQAENSPLKTLYGSGSSRRSKGDIEIDSPGSFLKN